MIKYYAKERGGILQELLHAQRGCWINVYPPYNRQEINLLSEELDVPLDYFFDSLDIDERSRYEQEDGVQFIVLKIPIKNMVEDDSEAVYLTIPIGIIEVDDYILTISAFENPVIDYFLTRNPREFESTDHSHFALLLFERTVFYFLHYLKFINNQRNLYEKELYNSSRNQELSKLMRLQKSLVYFVTTLRDNEMLMMRMQRSNFLNIREKEEREDFFEAIIIDMQQAQDMARIYTDILNSTMDSFPSIISNNLNSSMERLTTLTVILMAPTLVASFFGMNTPVPGRESNTAFYWVVIIATLIGFLVWWIMRRKN